MEMMELLKKVTAASGFTHAAGVEVVAAEVGTVTLDLAKKPELLQFSGSFHGGVLAGLADHCAGAAATTSLAQARLQLPCICTSTIWRQAMARRSQPRPNASRPEAPCAWYRSLCPLQAAVRQRYAQSPRSLYEWSICRLWGNALKKGHKYSHNAT